MKGLYIHNIIKYVEWPDELKLPVTDGISVCVLGEEKVKTITNALPQKPIRNRAVTVVNFSKGGNPKDCQVLFISNSENWRVKSVLAAMASDPILTIGDDKDFAKTGGMVQFLVEDDRLAFEINFATAQKAGLHVSSQLLQLARKVYR